MTQLYQVNNRVTTVTATRRGNTVVMKPVDLKFLLNKPAIRITAITLIISIVSSTGGMLYASDKIVRVGVDRQFYPYSYVNHQGEPAGFNVDLIKAIAAESKIKVKIIAGAWPEILAAFNRGQLEAIGGMAYSDDRAQNISFSQPFAFIYCAFFC